MRGRLLRTRIGARDFIALGAVGLRARPARAALSAIGIAVGVAALVSVFGVSDTSRAHLLAEIDRLGTDVLEIEPGQRINGERSVLPDEAPAMLRRLDRVHAVAAVSGLDATVRRTDLVGEHITGGITVLAAEPSLLAASRTTLRAGRFIDHELARLPVVVLGDAAARRLGIDALTPSSMVWLGEQWFTVIGILDANPIASDIDRSAIIGTAVARQSFYNDVTPTTIYVRTTPDEIEHVRALAAAAANPTSPSEIVVLRPTDALIARAAAKSTLNTLLLVLGAVTVVVGGIGIANIMIIAVLERRSEIGLRRVVGATAGHITAQFLLEACSLGLAGGTLGAVAGTAMTAAYGFARGGLPSLGVVPVLGGVVVATTVAGFAGIYPALRASRMTPAEALRGA